MMRELPPLPPPSIRVTHETDTVYCADVPKDQVPPHDDYWSLARVIAHGEAFARAAMERAAQIAESAGQELSLRYADPSIDDYASRIAAAIRAEIEKEEGK
jgi:hypothetical protein